MERKVVVVGGVAGGMSFAARLARLQGNCRITVLERGSDVSFANCGMPYYIGGVIKNRAVLTVASRAMLEKRFGRQLETQVHVDPDLIGGVRVVVGDEVLDTSVRARLQQMTSALTA